MVSAVVIPIFDTDKNVSCAYHARIWKSLQSMKYMFEVNCIRKCIQKLYRIERSVTGICFQPTSCCRCNDIFVVFRNKSVCLARIFYWNRSCPNFLSHMWELYYVFYFSMRKWFSNAVCATLAVFTISMQYIVAYKSSLSWILFYNELRHFQHIKLNCECAILKIFEFYDVYAFFCP